MSGADGARASGPISFQTGARSLASDSLVRAGELAHVALVGQPDDLVLVFVSLDTGLLQLPAYHGYLIAGLPFAEDPILLALPGSGELSVDILTPLLPPGEQAGTVWLQALMSSDGVQAYLSS